MLVAYRGILYAEDDTTPLTPALGAPHSRPFKIATITGSSDGVDVFEPVLDLPSGSNSKLDRIEAQIEQGKWSWRLLDRREPTPGQGSHKVRFGTAFFGDSAGQERYKGLRWVAWRSDDGGRTWPAVPLHTGRITAVRVDAEAIEWDTKDASDELASIDIFGTTPHSSITYYARESLWPIGLLADYGPFNGVPPFTGVMGSADHTAYVIVSAAVYQDPENLVTARLNALLSPPVVRAGPFGTLFHQNLMPISQNTLRARVKQTSGGSSGTISDYYVEIVQLLFRGDGKHRVTAVKLHALTGGAAVPAAGVAVEIRLFDSAGTLFVGPVHRIRLWRDILAGKWSRLKDDGSVRRVIPEDTAAFDALEDPSAGFDVVRFDVSEKAKASEWLKKNILQNSELAYEVDGSGAVVPLDLRLPASLSGLTSLTDADLDGLPKLSTSSATVPAILDFTFLLERLISPSDLQLDASEFPDTGAARIVTTKERLVRPNVARPQLGERTISIAPISERTVAGELIPGWGRKANMERRFFGLLENLATQFAAGALEVSAPVIRSVAKTLRRGQWVIASWTGLPDPSTNRRGGPRLLQVLGNTPGDTSHQVEFMDAGVGVTALVPTPGTLSQQTGNERHGVTQGVARNVNDDPVRIEIAVTDHSVTLLANVPDTAWVFGARATADGDVDIEPLQSGARIWSRMRSEPADGFRIPSAYISPSPAFVDLDVVPPIASLGVTVDGQRAHLEWLVGDSSLPIDVYYCTPSGGTPQYVLTLPAGSIEFWLEALAASTTHKARLVHNDGHGGTSAAADVTFSTTSGGYTIPGPPAVAVLAGELVGFA